MPKIRVLIVDDAVVIRQMLSGLLSSDPEIEVAGTAANGRIAMSKIPQLNPDVVTLDVEMPEMDGLQTLREIRKLSPRLPVIMFSTLTERGAATTIEALAAGANDHVAKPANVGSVSAAIARISQELVPKIKSLAAANKPVVRPAAPLRPAMNRTAINTGPVDVVTIGVSTGGPNALSAIIPQLPGDLRVPVLIVQHMPAMFTGFLAERLGSQSSLKVCEAKVGQPVLPGHVYIAPGDFHMTVERNAEGVRIALNQDMPENSCRPAVDVLFRSVARVYGPRSLALILTGMGSDGYLGCQTIQEAGGCIYAQDEATSVVWGMPSYVVQGGLAQKVLPLDRVAQEIIKRVGEKSPVRVAG